MRHSMRHTLLSILFIFLSSHTFCQSLSDLSFGTDSTFEVVTWNIEWFPKNGSITVDSVSKIIESLNVDLLALQEIDDSTICRQMINNLSDYELFMSNDWFGGLAYVYNSSTISINSIYKIYDTSQFWNAFPRSPLVMDLKFMGENIIVINNHFKCCGDGLLDSGNSSDEEARRYEASTLLKQYIDINFPTTRVIVLGDLNDILTDGSANNVFQMLLDDSTNYVFADETIANSSSTEWSFPGWPSHIDHILITNELFTEFSNSGSEIKVIKIDNFMAGGLASYDNNISDHRPIGLKIKVIPTNVSLVEVLNSNINIFPNPTNGSINIYLEETMSTVKLRLTNALGQVILTKNYKSTKHINFDIDTPKGVYFLEIATDGKVITKKIFKN
tara:strand:+ start:28157 stop:29320 length:1164 start_codon:yes stop_codon:yes gene_type:complete